MNLCALAVFLAPLAVLGQSGPAFEVASVKPSTASSRRGREGGPGSNDPTHYRYGSATLRDLVAQAWDLHSGFQVVSKLPVDTDRYDLAANVPAGAGMKDFQLMLQALLADRFEFKYHLESKEFPAYELTVAKTGLKMKLSDPAAPLPPREGFPDAPPGPGLHAYAEDTADYLQVWLRAQQQKVAALADVLSRIRSRDPVVDKSGLTGDYDFLLEFSIEQPGVAGGASELPAVPNLNTALQNELGLQLTAKKLPFDVVVVESFNRVPSSN